MVGYCCHNACATTQALAISFHFKSLMHFKFPFQIGGRSLTCDSSGSRIAVSLTRHTPITKFVLTSRRREVVSASASASASVSQSMLAKGSHELVQVEYAELNLNQEISHVGHVRIRQHANPLTSSLLVPAEVPNWKKVFQDPTLPLMVDIGCGSGRFLLWLAKKFHDSKNYMGFEIRQKLVKRAQFWVKELDLRNIYFVHGNATVSFEQLVASYPGPLVLVSVLCPDPYFKKRHHKRRVLQECLVDSISRNLSSAGKVFIQSDVLQVALEMRTQFDALPGIFEHVTAVNPEMVCDSEGWLLSNPLGIRTEREIHAEFEGLKVYRRLYAKQACRL